MIVVIADDFTGAAELAGISLRYGIVLPIFLHNEKRNESLNDFPSGVGGIICTDSRSLNKNDAKKVTSAAVKKALLKPDFIYKKIDSVLRGHVIDEIKIQQELTGLQKVLILPANPSLGRTIRNGEYFIDGKRINETGFVNDPEFPITNAAVIKMIGDDTIKLLKHHDIMPSEGIVIGEAQSEEDIKAWTSIVNDSWMPVGAGDFYAALLDKKHGLKSAPKFEMQLPFLYVCGTAFEERKEFIKTIDKKLNTVVYLPQQLNEQWFDKTGHTIKEQNKVIIAIAETNETALALRNKMAKAVKKIIERNHIKEIFIEGGSTAAAVLEELDIQILSPINELQRGVVRMKANNLFITVKPGSYKLPQEILDIYFTK